MKSQVIEGEIVENVRKKYVRKKFGKGNKSKKTNLYPGENKFLKALSKGLEPVVAVKEAYNVTNDNSARAVASEVLRRERFQGEMEKAGLTQNKFAAKFVALMDATRPIVVKGKVKDYPDYPTQHSVLKTGLKIMRLMPKEEEFSEESNDPLVVKAVQFVNSTLNIGTDKAHSDK